MHPTAFNLGSLHVTWYGVMVALGFIAGLWTASRRALRSGVAAESVVDLGPWLILGAIAGARALYVVSYWKESFGGGSAWEVFAVWNGGLVYYGGLIGATLAGVLYLRLKKLRFWKVADVLAPSIALGCVFGRIGCLLNGCCYGRVCHLPWAIRFPAKSLACDGQVADGLLDANAAQSLPVHPTQIYDSLLNLCLYAALAWLYRRKKFDGQVFSAYFVGYALLRSFVELFRGDYPARQHYLGGWATPAHLVSIVALVAGLALLWALPRPGAKRG